MHASESGEDGSDSSDVVCGPEHPPPKRAKWVTARLEKPYTARTEDCCSKRCSHHFEHNLCQEMREDVWGNAQLEKDARRERIFFLWRHVFVFGPTREMVCLKFVKHVFSVSTGYLYYKPVGQATVRASDKLCAILLWFDQLRQICDPIPNEDNQWQVYAPTKAYVHGMYVEDHIKQPAMWPKVSKSYFLHVWKKYKQEFRLRGLAPEEEIVPIRRP